MRLLSDIGVLKDSSHGLVHLGIEFGIALLKQPHHSLIHMLFVLIVSRLEKTP